VPHRIFVKGKPFPGLAMSRAIGDIIANSVGVSCIPEVKIMNIEDNFEHLLICSDGVWEFINCKTATNILCGTSPSNFLTSPPYFFILCFSSGSVGL
jgi:serine/threonine protein phosphatase PrpC